MGYCTDACTCAQLRDEFRSSFFSLEESTIKAGDAAANNRVLDIKQTFCKDPAKISITLKVLLFLFVTSITVMSIFDYTAKEFWLAYLTNWGWTFTTLYFLFSLLSSLRISCSTGENAQNAGFLVNTTWALYATALTGEIIIAILFWSLEFEPEDLSYISLMVHGGGIPLILFDGMILNRVPLRAKQLLFPELMCFGYLIWSVTHSILGIGNPNKNDGSDDGDLESNDDDAIYTVMSWKNNTTFAVILSVALLLVIIPGIFFICRVVTRLLPRRVRTGSTNGSYQEMGKV